MEIRCIWGCSCCWRCVGAPSCLSIAWNRGASHLPHHSAPTPTKHNMGPSQRVPRGFVFLFEFLGGFFFFWGGGGAIKKHSPVSSDRNFLPSPSADTVPLVVHHSPLMICSQQGQPTRQDLFSYPGTPCPLQWPTEPMSITLHPCRSVADAPALTASFGPAGRAR